MNMNLLILIHSFVLFKKNIQENYEFGCLETLIMLTIAETLGRSVQIADCRKGDGLSFVYSDAKTFGSSD